ncbi:Fe(3+) dicitrate ABC transporter substrate-binding protein [Gynuella sp.]|uniref:Fe(3+) dicitrate ABC transporter substrate-binding protein n=1 Tax=Gynuella sp. TaxID=2969146 RepID=UPI003D09A1A9
MLKVILINLIGCLFVLAGSSQAVTVEDARGLFTIDSVPQRIVALEFSFVDALAVVGVSPVGIADDKDSTRLLPAVRQMIGDYHSVGTRSQPSLEVIASLKPDLIIADIGRHEAVYAQLSQIAPTILLRSRRETYAGNLQAAAVIGDLVGKHQQMQARLQLHMQRMSKYAAQLPAGRQVQFAVARDDALFVHTTDSYAGGVIAALGMQTPKTGRTDQTASRQIGLEQLVAINPEYLLLGPYVENSIDVQWQQEPLWQILQAVRQHHVYKVNGNIWARCRGILAAEHMAQDLIRVMGTTAS